MREEFEAIYQNESWGRGSGSGSRAKHTRGYIDVLQRLLAERQIRSVTDLGCGDWEFSRHVDWGGVDYRGFDLVRSVIAENDRLFGADNVHFSAFSGSFDELPRTDLLIAKDVLQHWSNKSIDEFLPVLDRYPYSLITNCVELEGPTQNVDVPDGSFRPLDIRRPPFEVEAEEIFCFGNHRPLMLRPFLKIKWRKSVLLIRRPEAAEHR